MRSHICGLGYDLVARRARMLTIVETGDAAGDAQAKPSDPNKKSNEEKDAYGGPHFHA